MPISGKDDNISDNFGSYEDEKSTPEAKDIQEDYRNLVGKSSDIGSRTRVGRIPQNGLLGNELSLFLKEVRFSE